MAAHGGEVPSRKTRLDGFISMRFPLLVAGAAALPVLVLLALLWAPSLSLGFSAPVAQRIFYLHIGAAIASYAAFSVTFASSLAVLRRSSLVADRLAEESARLGLLFAAITIAAGSIWAWAEWGVPWRLEDERLITYLVLTLVFVGYLGLRARVAAAEARARQSALYALAGYLLVPFSYFSIYLWRTLHPTVISPGGQGIGGQGAMLVVLSLVTYVLLFLGFLAWRLELGALSDRLAALQRGVDA